MHQVNSNRKGKFSFEEEIPNFDKCVMKLIKSKIPLALFLTGTSTLTTCLPDNKRFDSITHNGHYWLVGFYSEGLSVSQLKEDVELVYLEMKESQKIRIAKNLRA